MEDQTAFEFQSHVNGRNAVVRVFRDRIEWTQPRSISKGKVAAGLLTGGLSLVAGVKDNKTGGTEMIPVKSMNSVNTKRDGFMFTKVIVTASGSAIEFRVGNDAAKRIKEVLTQLMVGTVPVLQQAPQPTTPTSDLRSVNDRLAQLESLFAAHLINPEEYAGRRQVILDSL